MDADDANNASGEKKASGDKAGHWASVTNVERPSLHEEPPAALRNPPPLLIGAVVVFFLAIVAMVVAIAVLKAPSA